MTLMPSACSTGVATRTVRAAVAPLFGEPRISASMTSQLLAGAMLTVLEDGGDWLRVRGADDYEGWTHIGYLATSRGDESTWRLSLGCTVREHDGTSRALPLGARLHPESVLLHGDAITAEEQPHRFARTPAAIAASAERRFEGSSYLWGGVTPWGCDCSGFVQQVYALHGVALPRDAWQQALLGDAVALGDLTTLSPADLLFFSDRDDRRVTHVGVALSDGQMAHSALRRGGIAIEALGTDDPYVARLRVQCTGVRRLL